MSTIRRVKAIRNGILDLLLGEPKPINIILATLEKKNLLLKIRSNIVKELLLSIVGQIKGQIRISQVISNVHK